MNNIESQIYRLYVWNAQTDYLKLDLRRCFLCAGDCVRRREWAKAPKISQQFNGPSHLSGPFTLDNIYIWHLHSYHSTEWHNTHDSYQNNNRKKNANMTLFKNKARNQQQQSEKRMARRTNERTNWELTKKRTSNERIPKEMGFCKTYDIMKKATAIKKRHPKTKWKYMFHAYTAHIT